MFVDCVQVKKQSAFYKKNRNATTGMLERLIVAVFLRDLSAF